MPPPWVQGRPAWGGRRARVGAAVGAGGRLGAGTGLLVIGTAHLALAARRWGGTYARMARGGLVGSLQPAGGPEQERLRRAEGFWFGVTGVSLLLLGDLARSVERRGDDLPRSLGWGLAGTALLGGTVVPRSGFWALLLPAWAVLRRARVRPARRRRA